MRRRELIRLLGCMAATLPLAVFAQEPGRTYRLGGLHFSPYKAPHHVALFDELRRFGFTEGQNLLSDAEGYGLRADQLADHAAKIVKAGVDVILCAGTAPIQAAQQATKTIPILGITDDMVGSRLVGSLAKPDGNTTGVSILAPELDGKRQEILIEAVPGVRRIAALADFNTTTPRQLQALQDAAHARGVDLLIYRVAKPEEIAGAIETAKSSGATALNVLATPLLHNNRQIILERVMALGLPSIHQWPETSEEGGFIGYGPRLNRLYREIMARQLVKLLLGARPADLPVEQPTKFELAINLKTAKALGLVAPASFLARADEIIE
jgi:ABC-type uncharacterized transport system substrate-binding protein